MNWNGRKYFTAEVYIIAARIWECVDFFVGIARLSNDKLFYTTFAATRTIIYRTQCNIFCINYSPLKYLDKFKAILFVASAPAGGRRIGRQGV